MEKRSTDGFTILELMVVVCIAGILSGFAYLGKDLIRREQVSSITHELLADIQLARMNAITQAGKGYGIRFESPTTYVLFQFNDCNNDFSYDDDSCYGSSREEAHPVRKTLPFPIVLNKTNASNNFDNDVLIFDSFGRPRQKNWGMGMMTILVRHKQDDNGEFVKCVSISINRVRESRWNGYSCI